MYPSKNELLNNLREYSSEQIAEAIQAGVISLYELSKAGQLTPLMRRRIEERLANQPSGAAQTQAMAQTQIEVPVGYPEMPAQPAAPQPVAPPQPEAPYGYAAPVETDYLQQNTFEQSNKGMFRRPFSFKGRIRRLEYDLSILIYSFISVILNVLLGGMVKHNPEVGDRVALFSLPVWLILSWFVFAQSCKRCHDRGNSGWWQLIPFYGLVLLFGEGESVPNRYGDTPK